MRATSAITRGCTPCSSHSASRLAYNPGAPVRRTRIIGSPCRSATSMGSGLPRRWRSASGWSMGSATMAGSCCRVSNARPAGRATGTRSRPQCRRPSATASVISAALFSPISSTRSGCRARHSRRANGVNSCAAAELVKAMDSRPVLPSASSCMRLCSASKSCTRRVASACSARPASVSVTPLAWRLKRARPTAPSSALICWLSGGWAMPSCSAARVMWPASATARK